MDQTVYGLGVEDSATKWHALATGAIVKTSRCSFFLHFLRLMSGFGGIFIGFALILVDAFVVKGHLKNAICGHFGEQNSGTGASERRRTRLCGQVATRLVGSIFLILMVRLFCLRKYGVFLHRIFHSILLLSSGRLPGSVVFIWILDWSIFSTCMNESIHEFVDISSSSSA